METKNFNNIILWINLSISYIRMWKIINTASNKNSFIKKRTFYVVSKTSKIKFLQVYLNFLYESLIQKILVFIKIN